MRKLSLLQSVLAIVLFAPTIGCSDSAPASITENVEQSEIDAWKQRQAEQEAEMEAES